MAMNLPENKEKLTKAVINIIKKLKISTGSKREKYINIVRNEFNLANNEKWVITKLRMIACPSWCWIGAPPDKKVRTLHHKQKTICCQRSNLWSQFNKIADSNECEGLPPRCLEISAVNEQLKAGHQSQNIKAGENYKESKKKFGM
jgi:hypothetical protein